MKHAVRHVFAAGLTAFLLILSGMVYPQTLAHAAHHAHHDAAMHGTALCAWLCTAGQALETADIVFEAVPGPVTTVLATRPVQHPLTHRSSSASRGPPPPCC